MIYGYHNFEWSPLNPITDGYKNEDTISETTVYES